MTDERLFVGPDKEDELAIKIQESITQFLDNNKGIADVENLKDEVNTILVREEPIALPITINFTIDSTGNLIDLKKE